MANNKITLFLDCDDTILDSSDTVIAILNKRYGLKKTIKDLNDWYYRSIVPTLTQDEVLEIYDSDEFWDNVKVKPQFLKVFKELRNSFNWVIVSKGKQRNLELKERFIQNNLQKKGKEVPLIGLPIDGEIHESDKTMVNMSGGIQIDDKTECLLGTSAGCKVLIKNHKNVPWNKTKFHEDNFYIVQDWEEIGAMLRFFKAHPEFVKREYTVPQEEVLWGDVWKKSY